MPSLIARGRVIAAVLASALCAASPAAADVRLVDAYAGPVTAGTICTPEPDDTFFGTAGVAYVPGPLGTGALQAGGNGLPKGQYAHVDETGGTNLPDATDMTPSAKAGTATDFCAAFRVTPDATPGITGRGTPVPDHDSATDSKNGDDVRTVAIDLPAGVLAAIGSAGTCSDAAFRTSSFSPDTGQPALCPEPSRIGEAFVRATLNAVAAPGTNGSFSALPRHRGDDGSGSNVEGGAAFRLPAGPDELARIGIDVRPASAFATTKIVARVVLAPDRSGRIRVLLDLPRVAYKLGVMQGPDAMPVGSPGNLRDLYVEGLGLKLFGAAAEHSEQVFGDETIARTSPDAVNYVLPALAADFAETGTDCSKPVGATFRATTFGGPRGAEIPQPVTSSIDATPFTLTDCDALPFLPSVAVTTTSREPAQPTGVTVKLGLFQAAGTKRSALVKNASIQLPAGLELGAQVAARAGGLSLCTTAQFGEDRPSDAASCPAAAAVGTVALTSPLLPDPLVGKAYLGEQVTADGLPPLLLELAKPGAAAADAPRLKLAGVVSVDDAGQVSTTFSALPQLRFSELRLDFPAGPNALFVTPAMCGASSGISSLTPWSGQPAKSASTSLEIDQGCAVPQLGATLDLTAANPQAGARSASTLTVGRTDRSPWIRDITASLPAGLLVDVGIPAECAAAQAAVGDCPQASRIGAVRARAGAGSEPSVLAGSLYLTARRDGHAASAVLVLPARIGSIDLGTVVAPVDFDLGPTDAGLVITTSLPARARGVALRLQDVAIDLDRDGFSINPTACGPLGAVATVTAQDGQSAQATTAISPSGCESRPFAPGLSGSLTGETAPLAHPAAHISLAPRPGDSNLRAMQVTFPSGLAFDAANLERVCEADAFAAGSCSGASLVGSASASAAFAPEQLVGAIHLVRVPGERLPGLGVQLAGRFAQRMVATFGVGPQGRILARFDAIPDLPLSGLALTVDGGPSGPIQVGTAACAASSWDAGFVSQGGQTAIAQQRVDCPPLVSGPPKVGKAAKLPTLKLTRTKGLTLSLDDLGGRKLQAAKLTLPSGLAFDRKQLRRKNVLRAKAYGTTAKTTISGKSVLLVPRTAKATGFGLAIKLAGIDGPLKKGRKLRFRLRVAYTDGLVQTHDLTVKAP